MDHGQFRKPATPADRRGIWKALSLAIPLAVTAELVFLGATYPARPPSSGNPRDPKTWEMKSKRDSIIAHDLQRRQFWIGRVEAGEASFEEAGCGYRRGEWQDESQQCSFAK